MHKYTFDVKAFLSIEVEAESVAEARAKIDELDGAVVHLPGFPETTLSFDGEHDLQEIDGEWAE